MSYNQPPPQPGPYGQQPQQPGPYGAPPPQPPAPGGQPGSPGYGYPQQPPPPGPGSPYGPPQPPGPYGGQPGDPYGGQVPPPPGGGGGKGKVIGIIVAVVLVLGLAGGGIYFFTQDDDKGDDKKNEQADGGNGGQKGGGDNGGNGGGGDDQKPGEITDDGKQYKLTLPETLLGGQYNKQAGQEGSPDELTSQDKQFLDSAKVTNPSALNGVYISGSATDGNGKSVILFGAYGEVADPEASVDNVFTFITQQISNTPETSMVGSPETVQPEGFENGIMKCQLVEGKTPNDQIGRDGMCVWADNSTVAMVRHADGATFQMDINTVSKVSSDVRNEVRVER